MMIDDSEQNHMRRKLKNILPQKRTAVAKVSGETYKNMLPRKRTVVAKVSGKTYSKKCDKKKVVEKRPQTATNVITNYPTK